MGVEHGHDVGGAGAQLLLGKFERAPRGGNDIALQLQLDRGLPDREQRIVDICKGLDDGLAVGLQQFVLPCLGEFEIAEDLAAVEDRLRGAADELEERRMAMISIACPVWLSDVPAQTDTRSG